MSTATVSPLLTIEDLSKYLCVPIGTLYRWRSRGEGPVGYKVGKHVRFRQRDVEAWLAGRRDAEERY